MAASASLAQRLQAAWLGRGPLVWMLSPMAAAVAVLAWLRREAYRRGWLRTERLDVPVIVVGNLIAGGAGKTPTVLALVRWLVEQGHRPGIVSRGHGRAAPSGDLLAVMADTPASACGDEPLLLRRRAGVPVVVGRDRVAAARLLREQHPNVTVIVADDGLQHRRLGRDAEVIVFDERGIGNGWCLPAGPLREPMPSSPPDRSVVVYNAKNATTAWPGWPASRQLAGAIELRRWQQGGVAIRETLAALTARPVVAVAGLAQPERFFQMLRDAGLAITPLPLPDHFDFADLPWPPDTLDVIVTEKDATKLDRDRLGRTTVWVAPLDFTLHPATLASLSTWLPALR